MSVKTSPRRAAARAAREFESNLMDARNLMVDRRDVADCVDFRALSTQIKFEIEPDTMDPWKIHDWSWCLKGTRGYRSRVHPL